MMEMTRKEKKNRLTLYKSNRVYTYLKDKTNYFVNGYISEIRNKEIIFNDDEVGNIPIEIDNISIICPSKKIKRGNSNERS